MIRLPEHDVLDHNDQTPLPVFGGALYPENLVELDEQGLLTLVGYCKLLDHLAGLTIYRLRSHVRKSVPNVGQAELDEIDVGVALRNNVDPVRLPARGQGCRRGNQPRPGRDGGCLLPRPTSPATRFAPIIALTYDGILHFLEFRATTSLAGLRITNSCGCPPESVEEAA